MIRAILLWGRRSTVALAWPGLVLLVVLATWSRDGWQTEWDWAVSWGSSTTVLLGPVIAGLVAHDRAWRHAPTLVLLERTSPRGQRGACALPAAATTLGVLAWLVGTVPTAVRLVLDDAVAPRWAVVAPVSMSLVAVLLAAAFVGFAVGAWVPGRAAGPVAAFAVYAVFLLAHRVELMGLFQAGGGLGTFAGVVISPRWTVGHVVAHLGIALGAAMAGVAALGCHRALRRAAVGSALVVVLAGLAVFHQLKQDGNRVLVDEAMSCAGDRPQVCAPARMPGLVDAAEASLTSAYGVLADAGLPLQDRYVYDQGVPGNRVPGDVGVLSGNLAAITDGRLSRADLLGTLTMPRRCAALSDDEPPEDLLGAQAVVAEWLDARLDGEAEGRAPDAVAAAYAMLSGCEPNLGPVSSVG